MARVSWDFPCRSCFHKGTFAGFTLTLDGNCEDCHRESGHHDFRQKVQETSERLKRDLLEAPDLESFFTLYSKAKAAGISEAVIKTIYMQYQSKTKGLANPEEKIQAKRSRDERASEVCNKQSKLSAAMEANSATMVNIYVGLSGAQVAIRVELGMSIEGIKDLLREAYPRAPSIKLSANGHTINCVEALLHHEQRGESIYATFLKDVEDMSLDEVHEELAIGSDEFRGHLHTLARMARGSSAADVARYLSDNQVLLSSTQAQQIFDCLVQKVRRAARPALGRNGPRAQLIFALHSFCLDPYAIWEPNDDCDECLWANMWWGAVHLGESSRHTTRGRTCNISDQSSSSSCSGRCDVNNLRSVLRARRSDQARPLDAMVELQAYEWSWRSLQ